MKKIKHVIRYEQGIHARPAGLLVKMISEFSCEARVGTPLKMVDGKRVFAVMSLGLKQGDEMTLTFDGPDEEAAAASAELFLSTTL